MKSNKLEIHDSLSMTDSVKATSWLSPELFLLEYEKYKNNYFEKESTKDLVMAYILLQLFLENHFHYYLRFLIGGGFSSLILPQWSEKEDARKKIDWLYDHLYTNSFLIEKEDFESIKKHFTSITNIRNLFAHGHPVTESSENGQKQQSDAKEFLTRQKFNEIRRKANDISDLWNGILAKLQNQENLLQPAKLPTKYFLDECKFQIF